MPVTAPSNRPSTARMPSTLSSAATKCISEVPGLPKQTSTPDPTSVRKRLSAPFMATSRLIVDRTSLRCRSDPGYVSSDEGAQSGDRLADNQRIHLSRAFIRINRFGISHETSDVVREQNAVAAEQLTRIANRFPAL